MKTIVVRIVSGYDNDPSYVFTSKANAEREVARWIWGKRHYLLGECGTSLTDLMAREEYGQMIRVWNNHGMPGMPFVFIKEVEVDGVIK